MADLTHASTDGERLNEYLHLIGWSKAHLAQELNVSVRIVFRWAAGRADIPISVLHWLSALASYHQTYPKPHNWKW